MLLDLQIDGYYLFSNSIAALYTYSYNKLKDQLCTEKKLAIKD